MNGTANEKRFPYAYEATSPLYQFIDGTWSIGNVTWYVNPDSNNPSLLQNHSSRHNHLYTDRLSIVPPASGGQTFSDIIPAAGYYVRFKETVSTQSSAPNFVDNGNGTQTMEIAYEAPMYNLNASGNSVAPALFFLKMKLVLVATTGYQMTVTSAKYYYNGVRAQTA